MCVHVRARACACVLLTCTHSRTNNPAPTSYHPRTHTLNPSHTADKILELSQWRLIHRSHDKVRQMYKAEGEMEAALRSMVVKKRETQGKLSFAAAGGVFSRGAELGRKHRSSTPDLDK